MLYATLLSLLLATNPIEGPDISGDRYNTFKGDLIIHPIQHATLVIQWNGKLIYVDPAGGAGAFEGIPSPDLILITDIHGDHMNIETLEALDTENATLIVPAAVAEQLPDDLKSKSKIVNNGKRAMMMSLFVEGVAMYNLPESPDSRHTKGRGNGYVLTLGGQRIYISGDTEDVPEMLALKEIDIAFVCMNLPYTMDVDQAAGAVLEFRPRVVYPYHYRGGGGTLSDVDKFEQIVTEASDVLVIRRNWYPNQ